MLVALLVLGVFGYVVYVLLKATGGAVVEVAEVAAGVSRSAADRKRIRRVHEGIRSLFGGDDWVIVDTETTGLGATAVAIELAVVDHHGDVLLNTRIALPKGRRISPEATQVHGITRDDLIDAPQWSSVREEFLKLTEGKKVIAYNADFDDRIIQQTDAAYGLETPARNWLCLMGSYSEIVGERWGNSRKVKWQKLPGAGHAAADDAVAAYRLMERIATTAPP